MEPKIDAEVIMIPLKNGKKVVNRHDLLTRRQAQVIEKLNYLPGGSKDGETHGETNTNVGPRVRADAVEKILPARVISRDANLWEQCCCVYHNSLLS